jgi:hypothetical protein
MLMSIGEFGYWTYFQHSGDASLIRAVYPSLRPYLELWRLDAEGLVENRKGDWYWGDWGTNKDTRILDNCCYALALMGATKCAHLTGNEGDAAFFDQRYQSIRANFERVFWTGSSYRSPGYKGETDDRGHGLAVLAGLTHARNHEAIAKVLAENHQASPYMEKYILEALFRMGRPREAMDRMLRRYRTHLAEDMTTLFEGWGIGSEGFGGGTINHSWSGGPLTLLSQYVAGIEPLTPGYARFRIKPAPGDLKTVEAVVPSVKGEICCGLRIGEGAVEMDVTVPEGTIAEVWIPGFGAATRGALFVDGEEQARHPLEVGPGRARISASLSS